MAGRGGKRAEVRQECLTHTLLNPLVHRELATIGAIDAVIPREKNPGYVMVLRAAKASKQANVEQMSTMIRVAGVQPSESGGALESMLQLQSSMARRAGTLMMLRAMRLAEAEIVREYSEIVDRLDGIFRTGIDKCWRRAIKRLTILTAHIAKRGGRPDVEERLALPMPLNRYFAHDDDRVCFRCLFDRPGHHNPLERGNDHPYVYLCSACHDEVLADFPPDIAEASKHWSDHDLEMHVLEKALGRPSKLKAELLVLAKMSDVSPDMPPPPLPRKAAFDAAPKRRTTAEPRPRTELGGIADSPLEQAYTDALFDYDTVRSNW